MKEEEINIAIAEHLGWKFRPVSEIPADALDYMERKAEARFVAEAFLRTVGKWKEEE